MFMSSPPVLIKDQYQIVAVTADDEGDHHQIVGYVLLDSAGVRLRHELTLDAAKAWMDRFIDEGNPVPPVVQLPAKPRHVRR